MFAQRVKERRKKAHLTQRELGDACGFVNTTVCSWEKGRFMPDVNTVERIAEVLGTTAEYLLGYADDPTSGGGRGASTEPGACVEAERLGERLKVLRKQHGLTLEQVGDAVGVGKSTVRKWETGEITSIGHDKVIKLAEVFQISSGELLSPDRPKQAVANRIRSCREEIGLSVDELAEIIGKNRATVYRYENGYIEDIPISVVRRLAEVLQTDPAYLVGWRGENACSTACNFGDLLKLYRESRGLSQQALADLLGTTKQVISRYESGQREPKLSIADKWKAKLGLRDSGFVVMTAAEEELLAAYRAADPVFQAEAVEMLRRHPKT